VGLRALWWGSYAGAAAAGRRPAALVVKSSLVAIFYWLRLILIEPDPAESAEFDRGRTSRRFPRR
jgi:hypothetical protein